MGKPVRRNRTRHIRRPSAMARAGRWRIGCDCGWSAEVEASRPGRVKTGEEVEIELDDAFLAHLKPGERRLYILVDQTPRMVPASKEPDAPMIQVAAGNFLMPEGTPVLLTRWHESDKVYFAHWLEPTEGASGVLPVGEIRTADGRVLRIDSPA